MDYNGKKIWSDEPSKADCYREAYLNGLNAYIDRMNKEKRALRESFMPPERLVKNADEYRETYLKALGIKNYDEPPRVEKEAVGEDEYSYIYRLKVFVEDDVPFYAMLLLPRAAEKKVPLVIFQHGGGGTPELAADFYGKNNYNKSVRRFCERGCAILMPQLLIWSTTESETQRAHNIPYDRNKLDTAFKRFGRSMTGFEISAIIRCLDYALTLPMIDSEKIAMSGLSYGGYFTLYTMAADTRIKAGYASCAFGDRDVYPLSDWTYQNSASLFQDAEVAALCAPRKLVIEVGKVDPVFNYESAVTEIPRVKPYFEAWGVPDNFRFNLHEGAHTFTDTDEYFDFIVNSLEE